MVCAHLAMTQGSTSPRVLHTVHSLRKSAGGPSRTVTALCRELGRQGANVELVSMDEVPSSGEIPLLPPASWVTTTLIPPQGIPLIGPIMTERFCTTLRERCTRLGLELIHDHGIWLPTNHATVSVALELGLPLVISPRGMLEPWALKYRAWKKRIAWILYQHRDLCAANVLHAASQKEADSMRRLGLRQPIALIPNGVEMADAGTSTEMMWPEKVEPSDVDPRRVALFLSRIHPSKGLLNLVDAWSQIRPASWRMVVAGPDEGGHRAAVEARVMAKGLAGDFAFIGAVDDSTKAALYRSVDLFILPSFSENFGVVVAEALSAGIPVLTTHGTPWKDLPAHGCGWWVPYDVPSLANALRQATALSDTRLQAMGERGRNYVRRYDWQVVGRQMLAVYLWILGLGDRPGCVQHD